MKKNTENIISAQDVSVVLGGHTIVDSVSFDIPKGSIAAIIGPNGSGKTTLLRALLGLTPYSGTVQLGSKNIAYVPQRFDFDRTVPMTVMEFMGLFTRDEKIIVEKLAEVGLMEKKNYSIGTLSGGELQRLLIAKSIINNPDIIFFDEPVSGIDIGGERNFYELLKHLNKEHNSTIIMVSHEIEIVHSIASLVICLSKTCICLGTPKEALTKETLEKLFGTNMAIHNH